MSDNHEKHPNERPAPDDISKGIGSWELWSQMALMMAGIALAGWVTAYLRLGQPSVYVHALVLPTLGVLTLPVIFWGLVKALFNRPVMRPSRTISFGLLVGVAFFCNIPRFTAPLSTEDWQSSHTYRLPFEGEWVVTAGGDSIDTNYHATTATYRWGYDFTRAADGKRFLNEGKELTDYACFGEPVLAPVAGKVVEVKKDEEDNTPGTLREDGTVLGNHLVLEVGPEEYLFIAHLKHKSIPLKSGQKVAAGDRIGACGNSGRSTMPHVHIHLQNSANFLIAESLPLKFSDYLADGERVEKGMPTGAPNPCGPFDFNCAPDPQALPGQRIENL